MSTPFKRGELLDYTGPTTGIVIRVKYVKKEHATFIVVERVDANFQFTVHVDDVCKVAS